MAATADSASRRDTEEEETVSYDGDDVVWCTCVICGNEVWEESMTRVSFCCNHTFCKDCVVAMFQNRTSPVVACPSCKIEHNANIEHWSFIPQAAEGIIDPHFVRKIKGMERQLESGAQLTPFMNLSVISGPNPVVGSYHCPDCKGFTPCVANLGNPFVVRCWQNKCGMLYCNRCSKPFHEGLCKVDDVVARDAAFVRSETKPCPRCKTPIAHYHGHGCHHVRCLTCSYAFCFVCGSKVEGADESEERSACQCPIFCTKTCGCKRCDECKPGGSGACPACDGKCCVCMDE
jgi:hypothetical protein